MTIVAQGTHHFKVMCSGPAAVSPRLREPTILPPAQVILKDAYSKDAVKDELTIKDAESTTTSLAFVYGTLKRGFGNHWLMEEQLSTRHCRLVGTAKTKSKYPLVCGPFQVPFLLDVPGTGEYVRGEIYQVDRHCQRLLDDLEGTSKGHYVRSPLTLTGIELDPSFRYSLKNGLDGISTQQGPGIFDILDTLTEVQAEAYFAAFHFTPGLYRAPHIEAYTEKEAATYTRRIHRPQNRTFVEHVYHWIEEQQGCN